MSDTLIRCAPRGWMARTVPVAVVSMAVVVAACRGSQPAQTAAPQGFPPTPVQIAPAGLTNVADATEYVGVLKSLRSTTVQPQIEGQITQILVKSGDRVAQGAP